MDWSLKNETSPIQLLLQKEFSVKSMDVMFDVKHHYFHLAWRVMQRNFKTAHPLEGLQIH